MLATDFGEEPGQFPNSDPRRETSWSIRRQGVGQRVPECYERQAVGRPFTSCSSVANRCRLSSIARA